MAQNIEVKIFKNPEKVAKAFAKKLNQMVSDTKQKRFDIALSGGKTPKLLFKKLAKSYADKLPWERLHFWWGDERCVDPDDKESNYRLAYKNLFAKVPVSENQIHRIKGENDPAVEAAAYAEQLSSELNERNGVPVFDLILLGLGTDGHTASIFPHEIEIINSDNICEVATHPETGQKRITLTGKVINNANRIGYMIIGEDKAKRVAEIMDNTETAKKLPAYYIEPENGEIIWYLDEAAGQLID